MNEKTETNGSPKPAKPQAMSDSPAFLDAIFLSSKTFIIMTVVVVLAIVVMGWFVIEISHKSNLIANHEQTLLDAKRAQERLDVLKKENANRQAENDSLTREVNDKKEALIRANGQLNEINAQFEALEAKLGVKRKEEAKSEVRLKELVQKIEQDEQTSVTSSENLKSLTENIESTRKELNELEGEVEAARREQDAWAARKKTIERFDQDFSQIVGLLRTEVEQLKTTNSGVQDSSNELARQVTNLTNKNQLAADELNALKSRNESIEKEVAGLSLSSDEIESITGKLLQSATSMERSTGDISTLTSQLRQTQNRIQTLQTAIQETSVSIEQLANDTSASRSTMSETVAAFNSVKTLLESTQADLRSLSQQIAVAERSLSETSAASDSN